MWKADTEFKERLHFVYLWHHLYTSCSLSQVLWECVYCLVEYVVSSQEGRSGGRFTDMVGSREERAVGEPASDKYYLLVSEGSYIFCSFWWVYVLISLCAGHRCPAGLCSAKCSRPGERRAVLAGCPGSPSSPLSPLISCLNQNFSSHDISAPRKLTHPWEDDPQKSFPWKLIEL